MEKTGRPDAAHDDGFLAFHKAAKIILSGQALFKRSPANAYLCRMEVTNEGVEKLARLSRLRFSDSEREEIKNDLQRMIRVVEKLNELDLEGVEPLTFMTGEVNVLRADEVKGQVTREDALKNAPVHDEQYFKVPKVIRYPKS